MSTRIGLGCSPAASSVTVRSAMISIPPPIARRAVCQLGYLRSTRVAMIRMVRILTHVANHRPQRTARDRDTSDARGDIELWARTRRAHHLAAGLERDSFRSHQLTAARTTAARGPLSAGSRL